MVTGESITFTEQQAAKMNTTLRRIQNYVHAYVARSSKKFETSTDDDGNLVVTCTDGFDEGSGNLSFKSLLRGESTTFTQEQADNLNLSLKVIEQRAMLYAKRARKTFATVLLDDLLIIEYVSKHFRDEADEAKTIAMEQRARERRERRERSLEKRQMTVTEPKDTPRVPHLPVHVTTSSGERVLSWCFKDLAVDQFIYIHESELPPGTPLKKAQRYAHSYATRSGKTFKTMIIEDEGGMMILGVKRLADGMVRKTRPVPSLPPAAPVCDFI